MTTVIYASTKRHRDWGGPPRYVAVVLYDTHEEFQDAIIRKRGLNIEIRTIGVFSPADEHHVYDKNSDSWHDKSHKSFIGTIRTSKPNATFEVLTHECVHAACAIYRRDLSEDIFLGDGCGIMEENLSYIIGDLTDSVISQIVGTGLHAAQ